MNRNYIACCMLSLCFTLLLCSTAWGQEVSKVWNPNLGNEKYKNPVIYADYSDPDVIRVEDDYYMTASSFNCVPGLPILHSKDLVNWQIVNYALKDLKLAGVPQDFFDKPQHGKGVWAPCIRYHKGEYFIYWGDPDFGIYVVKTKDILGDWDEPILILPGKGRIDPSPMFDEDGKVYMVHAWANSRAQFNSVMTLCELDVTGTKVISDESLIFDGNDGVNHTLEGGKFYKKDGYYYLLAPAGGVAMGWQIALRSKNIYGPYQVKRVLDQGKTKINGPHQGGLVQTQTGQWWFLHFQDVGPLGRISHLQPVTWKDGWPVMGEKDKDYSGQPVASYSMPDVGQSYSITNPLESDEFNDAKLGLQWSWHANPKQAWAFPSSSGYLRLYGQYYPNDFANMWQIPNLLLQKLPAPNFTATMKSTSVLMNEGDKSGLLMMGWDYAYLALVKTAEGYDLQQIACKDAEQKSPESVIARELLKDLKPRIKYNYTTKLEEVDLYTRIEVSEGNTARFFYSFDGKKYLPIGEQFQIKQGKWIGAKMGFFILNKHENSPRSWVDVDWFRVE